MAPTADQAKEIARAAIKIFAKHGLECCLVGSLASLLYGVSRSPNDVDLVVLTNVYDQERLKRILVSEDSRFYLVSSRNPLATYKVLWYSLYPGPRATRSPFFDCKVDVLVPGIMNVPDVPTERITMLSGFPVMPLIPQLLLKLQGWSDHRASHRMDMQMKQFVDIGDIDALLDIAVEKGAKVRDADVQWVPESMIVAARGRMRSYTRYGSPSSATQWKNIGLVA